MRTESWCGREDSNFHSLTGTAPSTLRVYQFRHDRKNQLKMYLIPGFVTGRWISNLPVGRKARAVVARVEAVAFPGLESSDVEARARPVFEWGRNHVR